MQNTNTQANTRTYGNTWQKELNKSMEIIYIQIYTLIYMFERVKNHRERRKQSATDINEKSATTKQQQK